MHRSRLLMMASVFSCFFCVADEYCIDCGYILRFEKEVYYSGGGAIYGVSDSERFSSFKGCDRAAKILVQGHSGKAPEYITVERKVKRALMNDTYIYVPESNNFSGSSHTAYCFPDDEPPSGSRYDKQ